MKAVATALLILDEFAALAAKATLEVASAVMAAWAETGGLSRSVAALEAWPLNYTTEAADGAFSWTAPAA